MKALRRALLLAAALGGSAPRALLAQPVQRGRRLEFPRDHGAHTGAAIEWWYATGWLGPFDAPSHGFQVTFFRAASGLAAASASRFAPRQLLFAHAAVTDLAARRHHHAERIARWDGRSRGGAAYAASDDASVRIGGWRWQRDAGPPPRWNAAIDGALGLQLELTATQPLLLQGDAGFSRKGPEEHNASHYYSAPQLAVQARLRLAGRELQSSGRGWLDHEWSDALLHPAAVGWDWIGINLADGGALTAFQLRRADGSVLWRGGSQRSASGELTVFGDADLRFTLLGTAWTSPSTRGRYPLRWRVQTPLATLEIAALLDAQEVDARASTGTVYWEGLAEAVDAQQRRVGLGYLEMTGYAERLRLG